MCQRSISTSHRKSHRKSKIRLEKILVICKTVFFKVQVQLLVKEGISGHMTRLQVHKYRTGIRHLYLRTNIWKFSLFFFLFVCLLIFLFSLFPTFLCWLYSYVCFCLLIFFAYLNSSTNLLKKRELKDNGLFAKFADPKAGHVHFRKPRIVHLYLLF